MLAKRPPAPEHSHGFDGLVAYIEQAHKADYTFMNKISSLSAAVEEMKSVAEMNRAVKDPVYHLILSWPKYEHPTSEQVREAVEIQMKALGFEEHQWIAAVHKDSDNFHVHVAVNKVHPETYRVVNPRGDYFILDKTCREIELRQGWTHDRGPYSVEYVGNEPIVIEQKYRHLLKQLSDGAKKIERYTGDISFERYVQDSDTLKAIFAKSMSWNDVHNKLRILGLELKQSDEHGGLVLRDTKSDSYAKASNIAGYDFGELKNIFGKYVGDVSETEQEVETILRDMTRMRATFSERDLDGYLSAFVDAKRQDALKAAVIESGDCMHLVSATPRGPVPQFTTKAVLEEERRALDAASRLSALDASRPVDADAMAKAVGTRTMRADQLDVFNRVVAGGRVATVQGRAGVGKSYLMGALRDTYEVSGYKVIGLGPTNIIADSEIKDGFKEAFTVDKVINEAKKGWLRWDENTVLIVDEAGMISNDRYAELMEIASKLKIGKIILVGDDRQLPAVERGGMFAQLASNRSYDCGDVKVITRQKNERQRQAAELLSKGEFEDAMQIYHDDGLIKWAGTDDETRDALLASWKSDFEADEAETKFILSYRNADVDFFNKEIHDYLISKGKIHEPRVLDGTEYALAEAVMFTQTNKKLGVTNGMRGKIKSWTNGGMSVELENGKTVAIPLEGDKKFKGFRQAHAGTVYKSQGATIARTYLHHTSDWKNAAGYVALTRQTKSATVFASKEVAVDWRDIARQMKSGMTKTTASSYQRAETRHQPQPIVNSVAGEAARLVELLAGEVAERKAAADAAPEPETLAKAWKIGKSAEMGVLKDKLFKRFGEERKGVDELAQARWIAAVAAARKARNDEIGSLRMASDLTVAEIKSAASGPTRAALLDVHQAELRNAVTEARGRHRAAVAEAAARKPKNLEFEAWLEKTEQDADVRKYRKWRAGAHDREQLRQLAALVDLKGVLRDADWRSDAQGEQWRPPVEARKHGSTGTGEPTPGNVRLVLDSDGAGVRWFDPSTRKGGGLDALLARLYPDEGEAAQRCEQLIDAAQIRFDAANLRESDRLDHRVYDAVQARRDWETGKPIIDADTPQTLFDIDIKALVEKLGDDARNVRVIRRPGGPALICATHDKAGNKTGWELVSARYMTRIRGSKRGAETLITAVKHVTREARKHGQTLEMSQAIRYLTGLDPARLLSQAPKIVDSVLVQCQEAAAFLATHPRTLTAAERRAVADFPRVLAEITETRRQLAKLDRAAAETPAIAAALRRLETFDINDSALAAMSPKPRHDLIRRVIDATHAADAFLTVVPVQAHKPGERARLKAIKTRLGDLKRSWVASMSSEPAARSLRHLTLPGQGGRDAVMQRLATSSMLHNAAQAAAHNPFFRDDARERQQAAQIVDIIADISKPSASSQPRPAAAWTPPTPK
jgi:hypothetical protein